jgi:hypothetical protein
MTVAEIRDAIYEDLKLRVSCHIVKYNENSQDGFVIELSSNAERIVLIDFNDIEVEVYDGSPVMDECRSLEYTKLDLCDPKSLSKLYTALQRMNIKMSIPAPDPNDNQPNSSA